ncbi:hypothetical protein [Streptomyces triticirhizae]|uniref:Uncharacterized protein n=1 Tax=Streptomyces triticirhizae TaxID=2483353 RepID=A0A3M2LB23_9ACTN|nr:hypothetical protein [Streptomyces triticirhizae]RMI34769.1 hypothetical protein EBN88_23080 [Streptomyces triticirhizae]
MNIRTLLRTSSALWIAPLALGLILFYYVAVGQENAFRQDYGWAPTLVSAPLEVAYAFAYGVTAALGAWESGRLRRAAVWELAPARSRYLVAAQVLLPVVGLGWLMLCLLVTLALARAGVVPTPVSLGPLVLGLVLCGAHAVVGFAVGLRAPAVVAAPVLAVLVWLVVATSRATDVPWRRYTLGQYGVTLEFGETATVGSLVAQALPTVALALAVAALWLPLRQLLAAALALTVLVAGAGVAHAMTRDWTTDPLRIDAAPMTCAGQAPRVCMPEATVGDIEAVRTEVVGALDALVALGIAEPPGTVTDSLTDGRRSVASTEETWRLGLTSGERQGTVRYRMVTEAVDFPCYLPEPRAERSVLLWASERTGVAETFWAFLDRDPYVDDAQRELLREIVDGVLAEPDETQLRWYHEATRAACEASA